MQVFFLETQPLMYVISTVFLLCQLCTRTYLSVERFRCVTQNLDMPVVHILHFRQMEYETSFHRDLEETLRNSVDKLLDLFYCTFDDVVLWVNLGVGGTFVRFSLRTMAKNRAAIMELVKRTKFMETEKRPQITEVIK
jgi:hypothetical protein